MLVTPPPKPSPPTPSPEDIAKAEAAKLANIPRIVQVLCNYGLKEATFTFSSGGQTLFEETLKGKKKKGGFLGIKGSYQGTFTHTITVPAGAPEVSIHVVAKDGATDLTKAIKMPPPGGFVPTLAVEVDSDHLSLNWKSPPPQNSDAKSRRPSSRNISLELDTVSIASFTLPPEPCRMRVPAWGVTNPKSAANGGEQGLAAPSAFHRNLLGFVISRAAPKGRGNRCEKTSNRAERNDRRKSMALNIVEKEVNGVTVLQLVGPCNPG